MSNQELTSGGRPLFDTEAEQAVLGAMLLSSDVASEVEGTLGPEAFYRPAHATLFSAIVALNAAGEPADPVTVTAALTEDGSITRVGGMEYIHELVHAVPTAANGTYYARTVADLAQLRELDLRARKILRVLHEGGGTASEVWDQAQQMLADAEVTDRSGDGLTPWREIAPTVLDAVEEAAARGGQPMGVPTGLIDLDRLLNGARPGQLIVIAGRPGMGKSVALTDWMRHAATRHKLPSLIFSLEMTKQELGTRLISAMSRVQLHWLAEGALDDQAWSRAARAVGETGDAPLWVDDTPDMGLADIRNRARRHARQHGAPAVIGVDYLQLIKSPRAESRQVAVSETTRGLKLLAKELDCPVIAVAQLNRGPEQRVDKRPQLSDLRESGAIEQDADVVILLHREDYYDSESPRAGEVDFIVAKHRGGPTDTITAASQLHFSRFVDMAVQ